MNQPIVGTHWRRDELIERLAATLDHAQQAAHHLLLPSAWNQLDEATPSVFLNRAKFVCETSLLLHLASHVPNPPAELSDRLDDIADLLTPFARDHDTRLWMRLRPAMAAELGVAHLCLTAYGRPDPDFHAEYCASLTQTSVGPSERVAWKDLEAEWHRSLGAPLPELDIVAATGRTAYNQGQDVICGSREAAYAVTHGLIYASNFGADRPVLARPEADLTADLEAMTARCLDEDDYDLGAEVLFSWPFLRADWTPTATFALQVLAEVTDTFGILPSMTLQSDACAELDPAEQGAYYFRESYHTVYVWGLLMAAILRTGQPVPHSSAPSPPGREAIADRLLALMPPRDREPEWIKVIHSSAVIDRGALVSLIADAGVRRAILAKDFARAHQIVQTFLEADVPPTSMVLQAAEMLARLAQPVGTTAAATPVPA